MGYTHYFTQKKQPTDEQWHQLCQQVTVVVKLIRKMPEYRFSVCDGLGEKKIRLVEELFTDNGRTIAFNGDARLGLDHETFLLSQKCDTSFNFCKTARKPYDFLVTAILILVNHHCPDCYRICSDGEKQEWEPVLHWLNTHLGKQYKLPRNI